MSRLRFFTPALVCLLVLLQLAGAVPTAEAFDGPADEPSGVIDDGRLGKASAGDQQGSTRLGEAPVGSAAGRGFAPEGAVALALGLEPVRAEGEDEDEDEAEVENDIAGFAATLVSITEAEYASYGGVNECSSASLRSRIADYWRDLGMGGNGCNGVAWSAAFISAMLRDAGAGSQFRYSSAHRDYIADAFAGGRGLYGSAIDANGATAHPGDLVCSGRLEVSGWRYADFENWYASGASRMIPTHCDFVVAVSGGTVAVVGGNVGNQVSRAARDLGSFALVLPLADPLAWEAEAFDEAHAEAVAWLNEQQPGFDIAPPARGQVVHLKNYMWIHGGWETASFESQVQTVEVIVTVTPVSSLWRLDETAGNNRRFEYHCSGPGHPYVNPEDVSTCGHTFDHSSSVVGDVALTTAIVFELTVESSLDDSESNIVDGEVVPPTAPSPNDVGATIVFDDEQDAISQPFQFPLWVNEVLTWGIEEDGEFSAPGFNGDPIVPEEDGYNCGIGENIAYYGTVGLPLRAMGITCGDAFGLLEHVTDGLLACGEGVVNSITQVVELLVGAVTDPVGTVKDGVAGIQALIQMAQDDLGEFGSTVALGLIGVDKADWDNAANDDERRNLVISGICAVAFEALLGGAAKRIFNLLPIGKRPRGGSDTDTPDTDAPDGDAPHGDAPDRPRICRIGPSSFPTGTRVRMGTGELVAIEHVEPGDYVLAADPTTGQWSNQLVLDQWSYLDTDQMTTAALADGSTITATDHHLFWVDSDQEWIELEHVGAGDQLLTPEGVTTVASVLTHPKNETLVWELDTAGPDTFTVHTGTADLLVHNADGCRTPKDKDTLDGNPAYREGLSPRETAKLEAFLRSRLAHLQKWHDFNWERYLPVQFSDLAERLRSTQRSIDGDLDASDVSGRTKELRGETTPGDHVNSTTQSVRSIENSIEAIDEALTRPGNGLTPEARDVLQEMRQDLLDVKVEMFDATTPRP